VSAQSATRAARRVRLAEGDRERRVDGVLPHGHELRKPHSLSCQSVKHASGMGQSLPTHPRVRQHEMEGMLPPA
jgi:hypothetical protein